MREILFRGKCVDNTPEFNRGTWVYGDLIQFGGRCYIHPQANRVSVKNGLGRIIVMHEVDPESVGQWTGLMDKIGKKIFEGDIIRDPYRGVRTVEFFDGFYYPFVAFPEINCWNASECVIISNRWDD